MLHVHPFGCTGPDGAALPFTWDHVQFYCQQCEIVEDRRGWVEAGEAAVEAMQTAGAEVPHWQWLDWMPCRDRPARACRVRCRRALGGLPPARPGVARTLR